MDDKLPWFPGLFPECQDEHVDEDFVQSPEKAGDIHIIEFTISTRRFNKDQIDILNYCRLYLHVTTISLLC
jgi:hypothetical protein